MFAFLHIFRLDRVADTWYWNFLHGFRPTSRWQPKAIERAFEFVKKYRTLESGDYYEFGIYKGYSLFYAQKIALVHGVNTMRFFGFDSFTGMPKVSGSDAEGDFYEGQYACSKDNVVHNLASHGATMRDIILVQGFFQDSLTQNIIRKYTMRKICIAMIDSDLYSSAVVVLKFIKNLLMINSIIIFDDWNSFSGDNTKGERRALREFRQKFPSVKFQKLFSYGWHGQAFRVISV